MKEICGAARNLYLVANEAGELKPMIEGILMVSEPTFVPAEEEVKKVRLMDTLRFHTTPDGLRQIAEQFDAWADEADALQKKTTVQPT